MDKNTNENIIEWAEIKDEKAREDLAALKAQVEAFAKDFYEKYGEMMSKLANS